MIFSSVTFLFMFLPIVLIGYWLTPNIRVKNIFLVFVSLLFYAWGEPVYIFLMLFSVLINWLLGLVVEKFQVKSRLLMVVTVSFNLSILIYFKYIGFLIEILNSILNTQMAIPDVRLPIGISFFTFQALSYVVDVYRKEVLPQRSYWNLLLYISLFPQLIAGPIVKYHDIETQIGKRNISVGRVVEGLRRFIIGLSKKIIIANNMALVADTVFNTSTMELNAISVWIGAISYLFQIYFDFSGYSDMAIGLGKVFGFDLLENFNYPFTATSIKDFWRRWHISLSTWFREYLYIPLGGNRGGKFKTYRNQMIVFLATGVWHGANLTFVLWGVLHGLFLILESSEYSIVDRLKYNNLKRIYTMLIVTLLFVLFRADSIEYGLSYIGKMFMAWEISSGNHIAVIAMLNPYIIFVYLLALIGSIDWLPRFAQRLEMNGELMRIDAVKWEVITCVITIVLLVYDVLALASDTYNPFIYFRF